MATQFAKHYTTSYN